MSGAGLPLNMGDPNAVPQPGLPQLLQQMLAKQAAPQPPAAAPAPAAATMPQTAPQTSGPPANPQPGDVVNFHKFKGGKPSDPNAWEPLQGHDFLMALHNQNPVFANQVQAIMDGRAKLPPQSRINPTNKMIINAVYQADPNNFDAINTGARQKLRDDFVAGNSALNIRQLNQAIGHLQAMLQEMPNVAGHKIPLIGQTVNAIQNAYEQSSGEEGITNYATAQSALASEMAALLKGKGSSNETEVKKWVDNLSPDRSDEQKMGGARKLTELLKSRLDELHQQYQQGMGTTATPFQVLNPHAAAAYQQLSVLGQKTTPQQQAAPSSNPAIDALMKKYGGQP